MTDRQTKAVADAILACEVPDGYDRNGSHEAGECREYHWSLKDCLREEDFWKAEHLARAAIEASDAKYVPMLVEALKDVTRYKYIMPPSLYDRMCEALSAIPEDRLDRDCCPVCGEDHEGNPPLACETGDGA